MNKDEDLNDEFDPVSDDKDSDFAEFDTDTEKTSLTEMVRKNPAIKIGLIVAGLLVVVGGIILFGGSDEEKMKSTVATANDVKAIPGTENLSPAMREIIEEENRKNAESALKTGGSVFPQPIDTPKQQLTVPADQAPAEDPLMKWRQLQDERIKQQQAEQVAAQKETDPAKEQALQGLIAGMTSQMNKILGTKKTGSLKLVSVTNYEDFLNAKEKAKGAARQSGAAMTGNTAMGGSAQMGDQFAPPAKILLPGGAIEYAQLLIEANSDVQGPILGLIVSGPFQGSRILGTFQLKEKLLVLQFNTLIDKKGSSIPIQAYALDPDTTLVGMATDVDNRYWERIVLPAAADFVEGIGEAYANRQGNTTIVTGDVVVQDQPDIDVESQVAAGVEKAAERVSNILAQEGNNTKPLVRVRAGTPMGILFMAPITDQDVKSGQTNPATARTMQQQQQATLLQQSQQSNQPQSPYYLIQGMQGAQGLQSQAGQTTPQTGFGSVGQTALPSGYGNTTGLPSNVIPASQFNSQ